MKQLITKGIICVKDSYGFEYRVCSLEHILNEDESFTYIFIPNYDVIDLLGSDIFQGIPGLNLDLRKEKYIRNNILPVFISERVPQPNRVDLLEILEAVGMEYMNPIEFLIKTDEKYCGDDFYMIPYIEKKQIHINELFQNDNTYTICKKIIENIASGNEIILNGEKSRDIPFIYRTLLMIYAKNRQSRKQAQTDGILSAKYNGVYKGRKPIEIDHLAFCETLEDVKYGKISSKEASEKLGISIHKYYRYKKQHNL